MRPHRMAPAVLGAIFAFSGCMNSNPPVEPAEGQGIHLTGRVLGKNNEPVSGVAVALARNGSADTTDALGRYNIRRPQAGVASSEGALDTLVFRQGLQKLASLKVVNWIDELPDINVVQRDISGFINVNGLAVTRIEAVVYTLGGPTSDTVVTPFFYNPLASNYSGFVYFAPPVGLENFATYINVYVDSGRFTGRSQTVPFNSMAGNITVPPFGADNAFPVPNAGRDTSVAVNSALTLHGAAVDGFGGSVAKREWNINGQGFQVVASGDTTVTVPSTRTAAYTAVLRVTDNDGNAREDSRTIQVTNDDPVFTAGLRDTAVGLNATLTFHAPATDSQGVARYLWDFNGDGVNEDTTLTDSATHVFPGTAQTSRVVVTAQDAFDGVKRDTGFVYTLSSGFTWTARTWGDTANLLAVTWTGTRVVAVGNGGTLLTSPDGIAWTKHDAGTTRNLTAVASNGTQVIVSAAGSPGVGDTNLVVSNDGGITWTRAIGANGVASLTSLIWAGGRYLGLASPGGAVVSEDGVNWTRAPSISLAGASGIEWTGSAYVCVSGNVSWTSPDAVTWTRHALGPVINTGSITWTGTRLVAYSGSGSYASPDGVTWSLLNKLGPSSFSYAGVWTRDQVVTVGPTGLIAISPDQGGSWVKKTLGDKTLRGVTWTGTRTVAVGFGGTILTSP